jgi:hypothetical protein
MTDEEVFTVAEIAIRWKRSGAAVTRQFIDEPGVLRFGHPTLLKGRKYRRRYFSIRVPKSVLERVEDRLKMPRPQEPRQQRRRA